VTVRTAREVGIEVPPACRGEKGGGEGLEGYGDESRDVRGEGGDRVAAGACCIWGEGGGVGY